jgi:hypothetical protein
VSQPPDEEGEQRIHGPSQLDCLQVHLLHRELGRMPPETGQVAVSGGRKHRGQSDDGGSGSNGVGGGEGHNQLAVVVDGRWRRFFAGAAGPSGGKSLQLLLGLHRSLRGDK